MKRHAKSLIFLLAITGGVLSVNYESAAVPPKQADKKTTKRLATLKEARQQAEILHETFHATLQIVHLKYYREDEGLTIPSHALEFVFDELTRQKNFQFHWLAVNAEAMNVDHKPQDAFERDAVKALAAGKTEFVRVEKGIYRHAGAITLPSQCLKCHLPNRKSTEARTAGLVIGVPISSPALHNTPSKLGR